MVENSFIAAYMSNRPLTNPIAPALSFTIYPSEISSILSAMDILLGSPVTSAPSAGCCVV